MSKKRVTRAGKAAKTARKKAARTARTGKLQAPAARSTAAATIFVYDVNGECRVRTSPQLLSAGNGHVEWTVVNLTSHEMPDVEITWQKGSPWDGKPIAIRNGNVRLPLQAGKAGRYKYNVTCNGYTEDPEIEYPQN